MSEIGDAYTLLARKVTRAKWEEGVAGQPESIRAHAICADLKVANDDSLSFWICGQEVVGSADDAALAMASGGERLDAIQLAIVESRRLEDLGVRLARTPGDTPVSDLTHKHVDAVAIDMEKLGTIAREIATAVRNDKCHILTRAQVKALLKKAIEDKRLSAESLDGKLRAAVSSPDK